MFGWKLTLWNAQMNSVCVIPSRAGSKNKGLWKLSGKTLVEWLQLTVGTRHTIVATDQKEFVNTSCYGPVFGNHMAETLIAVADWAELSDDTIMHVCQPSSPFIRRCDLRATEELLGRSSYYNSAQTVIPVPHNFHEFNQRHSTEDTLDFVQRETRLKLKTKQQKPERWAFGNLVSVRISALRLGGIFAKPSYGIPIRHWYGLDVDDHLDLLLAEAYLAQGFVTEKEILA